VFFVGEGGDNTNKTNVNAVIEDYGISIQPDAVVRTVYYKVNHLHICLYMYVVETY
jgi:intraflagellar transport protein 52